jgi:HAD superfamily hydrolase (TIGR01549 family)
MPAFIFDLDGTLIDSTYAHVIAWQQALSEADFDVDGWRIHRRVGMSGGLLLHALRDELHYEITPELAKRLEQRHGELFEQSACRCCPLRGSVKLLKRLRELGIPFGIATSGTRPGINPSLEALRLGDDVVVVEGNKIEHSKPEPDELEKCRQRLQAQPEDCFVVGDAVWDLLAASRARMFSIGLLTGGYPARELFDAGAHRVFCDPAELLESLYQLGID